MRFEASKAARIEMKLFKKEKIFRLTLFTVRLKAFIKKLIN
jgi:hypothetical protein